VPIIDHQPLQHPVRLGCVISRFNQDLTQAMADAFMARCVHHSIDNDHVTLVWVPGAVEIPVILQQMAEQQRYDALLCFGAVVRGETAHFDFVAGQCSDGCQAVALAHNTPVVFGVLTTEDQQQAWARIDGSHSNIGADSCDTAVHMISVRQQLTVMA
jgi:6,7-dimethyl-8-ribityllumazine synthase